MAPGPTARPGLSSVWDQPAALQVSSWDTRLSLAAPITAGPSHNQVTPCGLHAGRLDSTVGTVTAPVSSSSQRGIFHQEFPQREPLSPFPAHPSPAFLSVPLCVPALYLFIVCTCGLCTSSSSLASQGTRCPRTASHGPFAIPRPASPCSVPRWGN